MAAAMPLMPTTCRSPGRGLAAKRGLQDGEALRGEQRGADPLQRARQDEHGGVGARPHASEAAANHNTPTMKLRRRP